MVVCPVILLEPTLVDKLPSTERDADGFGSSGV
jgi:dUTPase